MKHTQKAKKILSVQDISCFGQCSNTVMLPVLSAAGLETVALPTALLSTHTGGFQNFTFLDLTEEMKKILAHFEALSIRFDYLCTGYFGSGEQIDILLDALPDIMAPGALRIIDPVLGDNGKLYSIYDGVYVATMRRLCTGADVITPNLTEACLLADLPCPETAKYDKEFLDTLFPRLHAFGVKKILLTGILFGEDSIGVVTSDEEDHRITVAAPYYDGYIHGTGDTLAAAFIGFLSKGRDFEAAARYAVDFVAGCLADTLPIIDEHWYGLSFERSLYKLTN